MGSVSRGMGGVSRGMGSASRAPMARVAPRVVRPPSQRIAVPSGVRARGYGIPRAGGTGTTRDRFGHFHRGRGIIFLGGAYPGYSYYPYGYGFDSGDAYDDSAQQQAAVQQPAPNAAEQPALAPSEYGVAAPQAAAPDAGQFILVRKDGRVVFAAAFTISGDHLTYITPEGARRSIPIIELDKETTRSMNEACGTTLILPS